MPVGVHICWYCMYVILGLAFLCLLPFSSSIYGLSPLGYVNEIDVPYAITPEQYPVVIKV